MTRYSSSSPNPPLSGAARSHRAARIVFAAALSCAVLPSAQAAQSPPPVAPRQAAASAVASTGTDALPVPARTPGDPWEPANRKGYAIQSFLDRHLIRPLAKVYRALTPGPIGRGIHNVLVNLSEPAALFNDVLQGRIRRAGVPTARLLINSTMGVLGLVDVASHMGLVHHDNEFGVTLGRYGMSAGPFLYIPMVGPSTVRDTVGAGVDYLTNPIRWANYRHRVKVQQVKLPVGGLDTEVAAEPLLDALLSNAVDPYATLRSAYLQNKQSEIDGEGVPADLPSFDEPPSDVAPATEAAPTPVPAPTPAPTPQPGLETQPL